MLFNSPPGNTVNESCLQVQMNSICHLVLHPILSVTHTSEDIILILPEHFGMQNLLHDKTTPFIWGNLQILKCQLLA